MEFYTKNTDKFVSKLNSMEIINDFFSKKLSAFKSNIMQVAYLRNNSHPVTVKLIDGTILAFDDFSCSITYNYNSIIAITPELEKFWRQFMYKRFGNDYKVAFQEYISNLSSDLNQ